MQVKTNFYDEQAEVYYNSVLNSLKEHEIQHIDHDDIIMLSNLRSQRIELENEIKRSGYVAINENSRGGKTYQVHPAYRAYMSCVGEIGKTINRIKRSLPNEDDFFDSEFENF